LAAQYVTVANVVALMIAVLPQKGQRHLSANGSADEGAIAMGLRDASLVALLLLRNGVFPSFG
jgi:hypothetical protein